MYSTHFSDKKFLTKAEFCDFCGISKSTGYQLMKKRKVKFVKCCEGLLHYYKIPIEEAYRYLREKELKNKLPGDYKKRIKKYYEDKPYKANSSVVKPYTEEPSEDKPLTEKPSTENPSMDFPGKENPWVNNTQSNPIPSKSKLSFNMSEMDVYRNDIKDNIDYDILAENDPIHKDMLDEIVELMAETLSSKKEEITIASNTHSMADVRKRFMDINSEHIEYIIDCVSKNTTKINNIKQYMLAAIFNAPNTIGSYYTTRVNHDLHRNITKT